MPKGPDQDHFDSQQEGDRNSLTEDNRVVIAANRLAAYFMEEINLPARFRKSSSTEKADLPVGSRKSSSTVHPRKINENWEVEIRFRAKANSWRKLIEAMKSKIDYLRAWRFIDLSPQMHPAVRKVTDCQDFCDFVDYLILRRDTEKCDADELGGLAQLLTAFQREVERRIQSLQEGETPEPADGGEAHPLA